MRKQLIESGALVSPGEMWSGLGITRDALDTAVQEGRMFKVHVGAEHYFPAFYLLPSHDRDVVESVTKLLGDLPGWSKWQFFTAGKASLNGQTPLEALANGLVDQVKAAAEAFSDR